MILGATDEPLPLQPIALDVLLEKYARADENSMRDVRERVAAALAANERDDKRDYYRERFLWALENGFIPAGRVNANAAYTGAGTDSAPKSTLMNCFVQPIGDSIADSADDAPGIYTALAEAAETIRRGGGVGYNFSALRPRGANVKSIGRSASGPLSYMDIFERSCATLETTDARRGAQMAVLNIEHPDIFEFIDAKREPKRFTTFNLSVGVSDAFMQALENEGDIELVHKATPGAEQMASGAFQRADGLWVYRRVSAREVWAHIMRAAYASAEPGVLFLDRINRENNLAYCEHIDATNPCGEQPLPAYGSCCLGSLNLTAFIEQPFTAHARFHFVRMMAVARLAVQMLDNVIDITPWPLAAQREKAMATRRIGLGFTGLADALIMLGLRYDTAAARTMAAVITETLRNTAYTKSIEMAQERGAFPLFDVERYLLSPFIQRLPQSLQQRLQESGIRNSHLLSIAPAGSISLAFADNVANGVEPAFAWSYDRAKKMRDGTQQNYAVEDYAYRYFRARVSADAELPEQFVDAWHVAPSEHVCMVAAIAPYIDAGISKTVNFRADYPFEQFQDLYLQAWREGLKGITVYREHSLADAVLRCE